MNKKAPNEASTPGNADKERPEVTVAKAIGELVAKHLIRLQQDWKAGPPPSLGEPTEKRF